MSEYYTLLRGYLTVIDGSEGELKKIMEMCPRLEFNKETKKVLFGGIPEDECKDILADLAKIVKPGHVEREWWYEFEWLENNNERIYFQNGTYERKAPQYFAYYGSHNLDEFVAQLPQEVIDKVKSM